MTRYESAVMTKCRQIIREYDRKMEETGDFSLTEEANEKICAAVKDLTGDTLNKITKEASARMKNEYNLADN
jgi:dipeptidase